jgi:hypothetical protein
MVSSTGLCNSFILNNIPIVVIVFGLGNPLLGGEHLQNPLYLFSCLQY